MEHIDLKRLWTQVLHKLWIIIAATIVGAIIGVLTYVTYANVMKGNEVYQIGNDFYIYFDFTNYPNAYHYYNAFTWDGILRDDPIVNNVLENTDGITKEEILEAVSGEMLSDYRILTVNVRGEDPDKVKAISDAYKKAVVDFADKIDMLADIELWTDADIEIIDEYTRDGNAAFLGGFIAFLISLFAVLFSCALDTRIYTENDWNVRYRAIPFLGKIGSKEYELNLEHIVESIEGYYILKTYDFDYDKSAFDAMRDSKGVIIELALGTDKTEEIDKIVSTLSKQDIKVVASQCS